MHYSKADEVYRALKKSGHNRRHSVQEVPPGYAVGEMARFLHRVGVAKNRQRIKEKLDDIIDRIHSNTGDANEHVRDTLASICAESDTPSGSAVCGEQPDCARCALTGMCDYYNRKPSLKDLPEDERPRERLVAKGAQSLSDAELIAILLRSGSSGESAVELARRLLTKFGDFRQLGSLSVRELRKVNGIGPAKAAEIKAAMEIAKRYAGLEAKVGEQFSNSSTVYRYFRAKLGDEKTEQFWLVMLDSKNRVINERMISQGSLTSSLVHPREVFKEAIRESAAAVIFVHNHPSGDPSPSGDDAGLTSRLAETGELVGIRVLDHVIIGEKTFYSFAEDGRL